MTFSGYIRMLINGIPHDVYIIALIAFCAGAVLMIGINGWKTGWRQAIGLLIIEYVFLLYASTIIFRVAKPFRQFNFTLFWSYSRPELFVENVMNVVVFVPVGLLATSVLKKHRFVKAMAFGFAVSVGIEALQFILKRGFSEFDDVLHNTLGTLIGCLLCLSFIKVYRLCRF